MYSEHDQIDFTVETSFEAAHIAYIAIRGLYFGFEDISAIWMLCEQRNDIDSIQEATRESDTGPFSKLDYRATISR
jgi:hypothetical protein